MIALLNHHTYLTHIPETGRTLLIFANHFGIISNQKRSNPARQTSPIPGRTIVISGSIDPIKEIAQFFKNILQPINSQGPKEFSLELTVLAHFEEDPDSGLDASLDDGFDNDAFPGLERRDNQK